MVCIYCHTKTQVTNSRPQKRSNSIWRRRECTSCKALFTSIEEIDVATSLRVKRSKGLEPYKKEKLMFSLYESLKHLEGAPEAAKELTETISLLLIQDTGRNNAAILTIEEIAAKAHDVLLRFDNVAGLHYQARHKHTIK